MPSSNPAAVDPPRFSEDIDSTCSTPFFSAPSSPGHGPSSYFFSAPASPMHFLHTTQNSSAADYDAVFLSSDSASYEFEFSSRFTPNGFGATSSMTSADELFFNGQIRPMKLSSHLATPLDGFPPPLMDLAGVETGASSRGRDLRLRSAISKFANHRARSMSPMRFGHWRRSRGLDLQSAVERVNEETENESGETTPSCSASSSSSRSSSSGRNSKKWIFLKDLLNRSKSEGRGSNKEISFWSAISLSPAKEKKPPPLASSTPVLSPSSTRDDKMKKERKAPAANGVGRRRSAHEAHYTAKRAQAAEMKKKTCLPYRQGVLGCLGFSSKSYSAFTRNLNPISSRFLVLMSSSMSSRGDVTNLLTDKESVVVESNLGGQRGESITVGYNYYLVGRLCAPKPPNSFHLMEIMKKVWRAKKDITAREWGNKLFLFTFKNREDRDWVLNQQPWHFETIFGGG